MIMYRNMFILDDIYNPSGCKGKEKKIKEYKDYVLDIIEEEDMGECFILYLKYKYEGKGVSHYYVLSIHPKMLLGFLP